MKQTLGTPQKLSNNRIPAFLKCIVSGVILFNWVFLVALFLMDTLLFKIGGFLVIVYFVMVSTVQVYRNFYGVVNCLKIYYRYNDQMINKIEFSTPEQASYFFIIPNYGEEIQVLTRTLEELSKHKFARDYVVVLAMEAGEKEAANKAGLLASNFQGVFKGVEFTLHTIAEGEAKGKASNVCFCVKNLQATFQKYNISEDKVLLTILDADSNLPSVYIEEIERKLGSGFKRDSTYFMLPQTFDMNSEQSDFISRTFDRLYTMMHFQLLHSFSGISFPLSNYSFSYNLIKKIGFYDVDQDAISEDSRTLLKTYVETKGEIVIEPIYAFSNQMSLTTHEGFFSDFKAKFWQEERHQRAFVEICFMMNNLRKFENVTWKNIKAFFTISVVWVDLMGCLWMAVYMILLVYERNFTVQNERSVMFIKEEYIDFLVDFCTLSIFFNFLIYTAVKFMMLKKFLRIKKTIFNYFDEVVKFLMGVAISPIIFSNITCLCAIISIFKENTQYYVADKKTKKKEVTCS